MMHLAAGALLMGIFEMNLNDPPACKSPSPKDGPQLDLPIVLHYGNSERTTACGLTRPVPCPYSEVCVA